ncbi:hypothetical protein CHUAL_012741 [Chamberlinius hualienensis]
MSGKNALSIQNLKKKLFQTSGSVPERYSPEYYWTVDVNNGKLLNSSKVFKSEIYQMAGINVGFKIKLVANFNARIAISIKFVELVKSERPNPRSLPNITLIIKDQVEEDQKDRSLVRTFQPKFNQQLNYDEWQLFHAVDCSWFKHPRDFYHFYCKNGNIMEVKVQVESLQEAKSFVSNNGVLVWKLENYEETKRGAVNNYKWAFESPYFYTRPQGYRMKIKIRLAKGVLTNVCFLTGDYDESLSEDFPHRVTLIAISPVNQEKYLVTSFYKETAESYCFNFPNHPDLMEEGIVHNNSVIFKMVIEPL